MQREYLPARVRSNSWQRTVSMDKDLVELYYGYAGGSKEANRMTRRLLADFCVQFLGVSSEMIRTSSHNPGGKAIAIIHPFIKTLPKNWEDKAEELRNTHYLQRTSPKPPQKYLQVVPYLFVAKCFVEYQISYTLLVRYLVHGYLGWLAVSFESEPKKPS